MFRFCLLRRRCWGVGVLKVYPTGVAAVIVVAAVVLIGAAAYVVHANGCSSVHGSSSPGALLLSALAVVRITRWIAVAGVVVVAATILVVGAWTLNAFPQPDIDVFELHVAAADVLRAGGNPYRDLAVVDTSPARGTLEHSGLSVSSACGVAFLRGDMDPR